MINRASWPVGLLLGSDILSREQISQKEVYFTRAENLVNFSNKYFVDLSHIQTMTSRRALHYVFKVGNRTETTKFYRDVLGMKVRNRF